jgi:hypothetical protein
MVKSNKRRGEFSPLFLATVTLYVLFGTRVAAEESEWLFENWAGPSFPVNMFVPDGAGPETKIVIIMHGASRDTPRYYGDWRALGEELGLIIVVPEFDKSKFKGSARYNLGFVHDPDTGEQRPEVLWTFSAIEPMFDEVVSQVGGKQSTYAIFGHSAGSQFVHRFMYYKPEARVTQYIAANAGWYTLPVADIEYPYGLTASGLDDDDLPAIFAKQLIILLGDEDIDANGHNLRKTAEAERQGANRLARGLTMHRVAKARAEELGLKFNWELFIIKGADHDNAKMAPAAAAIIAR